MSRKLFYTSVSSLLLAATVSGYLLDATLFGSSDTARTIYLNSPHSTPAPAAASQAKAAALAKYPGRTADRVVQLADGSYAVHLTSTPGPHYIFVSKNFQVTGAA